MPKELADWRQCVDEFLHDEAEAMKKILWSAVLTLGVAGLSSCAISQKPVQPPLPAPVIPVQRPLMGIDTAEKKVVQMEPLVFESAESPADSADIEPAYPSLRYVNERLFAYGRKLSRWKELDRQSVGQEVSEEDSEKMVRCFREIQDMINSYNSLRSIMVQTEKLADRTSAIAAPDLFELQREDVAFLENDCGTLLIDEIPDGVGWSNRDKKIDLGQLETLIARHSEKEEYEEVVQTWIHIPKEQRGRVGLRTRIKYGNALMYLHQEEKAADVYRQVVEEMASSEEQAMDLVSLRRVLADLYTAAGNYRLAGEEYKKISQDYENLGRLEEWAKLQLSILDRAATGSPELSEYSSLLRNFLGFIPRKDGYNVVWEASQFLVDYPYSPVTSNVDFIKDVSSRMADGWFAGLLTEIERLSGLQQFSQAEEYLDSIPADIIGPEKQLVLAKKKEDLLLASAVHKETEKLEDLQTLQRQWNEAMLLARDNRYDEAIVAFRELEKTDYADKAAMRIQELMKEAAKAERKRAAQLYIRYTRTDDIQTQQQLLVETRQILRDILKKYPDVEIRSKVLDNLSRVEQEMNALNPGLLLESGSSSSSVEELDGVGASFRMRPSPPAVAPVDNSGVQ